VGVNLPTILGSSTLGRLDFPAASPRPRSNSSGNIHSVLMQMAMFKLKSVWVGLLAELKLQVWGLVYVPFLVLLL